MIIYDLCKLAFDPVHTGQASNWLVLSHWHHMQQVKYSYTPFTASLMWADSSVHIHSSAYTYMHMHVHKDKLLNTVIEHTVDVNKHR